MALFSTGETTQSKWFVTSEGNHSNENRNTCYLFNKGWLWLVLSINNLKTLYAYQKEGR